MKRTLVLFVILGVASLATATTLGMVLSVGSIQTSIDTVYLFPPGTPTVTPGFTGRPGTYDTFDFRVPDLPDRFYIRWHDTQQQGIVLDQTNPQLDLWYTLPLSDSRVKLHMVNGIEEAGTTLRQVSALRATPSLFQGSTRLSFSVASPNPVRVDVCDATGRTVRTLFVGQRSAGACNLVWNAHDDADRVVQPGVYFVRVTVGPDRSTTKLVLTD